ncbi:DUF4192 domain-containing protein [Streptomyces sp. HNM0574]|uniref:DUF4192 domain-containing protein n=1 Tax=Streptomyces sp. HNM0574 TaxID=2714954 RepID=UPI00146AF3D2|nr:DUF4192 domain-containing protein [Streptomyces sp. HNM0574]NLU65724.1 DUF4192 domain-containing protein [Streptomyces sp. HNM0574]
MKHNGDNGPAGEGGPIDSDNAGEPGGPRGGPGKRGDGEAPPPAELKHGRQQPGEKGQQIVLRGPRQLADALPYLLGYRPDDSLVVVALQGERGQCGARIRIGIPASPEEWPALATQIAICLKRFGDGRGPEGAIVYLCRDPASGESAGSVMQRLRPLAQRLRTACGQREIPVYEALCLSGGRVWSYCCPDPLGCPDEGQPFATAGTSVLAAASAYAGFQVRGSQREMERRLTALGQPLADLQEGALDSVGAALVPRMLLPGGDAAVRRETLRLAGALMARFRQAVPRPGCGPAEADAHDDALLGFSEAATVILGLQDRETRDRAAEWMEGKDVGPALRLWRALARRCVASYAQHAAAPLTLAGWVAWSGGDEPTARVALVRALRTDPEYVFAQLLHRACNEALDPELLRRCLRKDRADRGTGGTGTPGADRA